MMVLSFCLQVRCRAGVALRAAACAAALATAGCARQAPAEQRVTVDAAQVFATACAKCHAADGSGGLPMVPNGPRPIDLRHPDWQASRSDEEIALAIRDGRGAMPPFGDVLSPEQVTALTRFVREMAEARDGHTTK
jgi:mono/diheme cytochrome c family protein